MVRYPLAALAVAILIASTSLTTSAQVGTLRGHVWMQRYDGQLTALADAQVDVFRVDIKGLYTTKTNEAGEFVFAGLPFIGTYTVEGSHPTAAPNWVDHVKVGGESCEVVLKPGDGKRLTIQEIQSLAVTPASNSAAEKAKLDELVRKNAEIEAANKKITEINETIARTFTAGNDALRAASAASKLGNSVEAIQKYTDAIAQYTEGLAADQEQPAILTNKAVALKGRGVELFNAAVRSRDDSARVAGLEKGKADFKAAAETASKAVTLLKANVPTEPSELQRYNSNKYAALLTYAESMRLYVKGDANQAVAGHAAFKEYIAIEPDPAKKVKAQVDMAQMLLDAGIADKALVEFEAILTTDPDNLRANMGAGFALYATDDKKNFQKAANYLQHFIDLAPATNEYLPDVKVMLDGLKNLENVTPQRPGQRKRP